MTRFLRPLLAGLTSIPLLLIPAPGMGESLLVTQGRAGASLDFRIIIPPIMRVLENSHPSQLVPVVGGDWSAEQRLVVLSNMRRGFCVTLRMNTSDVEAWRLQTEQSGGVTLSPVSDGYRLCTPRPGRYTLLLQHEFEASGNGDMQSLRWPVQTDITAL
ncbi:MAG: hypothetical protein Q7J44_07995 [Pseudotabrizicola sp.]|uniref:hypothetical protein n=1 Tax=Pseudotabrizicola sp. TaxID=2939647 RepID=UPI00271CCA8A|nr:hypothetical protein [Pseudotabrizicola sp.]MDO9638468.1 hypothetical protein [Pseudotabrizicola sp.]